ncbi:MAG: hypothetical protein AAFR96_13595 [Planctomycetota bacterium]
MQPQRAVTDHAAHPSQPAPANASATTTAKATQHTQPPGQASKAVLLTGILIAAVFVILAGAIYFRRSFHRSMKAPDPRPADPPPDAWAEAGKRMTGDKHDDDDNRDNDDRDDDDTDEDEDDDDNDGDGDPPRDPIPSSPALSANC